jgi:hypothetical protein
MVDLGKMLKNDKAAMNRSPHKLVFLGCHLTPVQIGKVTKRSLETSFNKVSNLLI